MFWQARFYGLRVLLVLTSANPSVMEARGGVAQYVNWCAMGGTGRDVHTRRAMGWYITMLSACNNIYIRLTFDLPECLTFLTFTPPPHV